MVGEVTMGENTKKYLGIGLIAVGVGLGGYAVYSHIKKDRKKASPALSGVGKKKKSKAKSKTRISKKLKRISL